MPSFKTTDFINCSSNTKN